MDSNSEEKKEIKKVSKRKTALRAIFEYLKKPPQRPQKALIRKPVKGLPYDVNSLSDGDLARQLRNYGQVVGPITETTRPLYQKKLIKLLQEEMKNPASVQPANTTPKAWEYSDNEEENQVSNRTFEVKKKQEVVDIPDDEEDDDDDVDASPEPPRQLTHQTKDRPRPPRESTPKKKMTIPFDFKVKTSSLLSLAWHSMEKDIEEPLLTGT